MNREIKELRLWKYPEHTGSAGLFLNEAGFTIMLRISDYVVKESGKHSLAPGTLEDGWRSRLEDKLFREHPEYERLVQECWNTANLLHALGKKVRDTKVRENVVPGVWEGPEEGIWMLMPFGAQLLYSESREHLAHCMRTFRRYVDVVCITYGSKPWHKWNELVRD